MIEAKAKKTPGQKLALVKKALQESQNPQDASTKIDRCKLLCKIVRLNLKNAKLTTPPCPIPSSECIAALDEASSIIFKLGKGSTPVRSHYYIDLQLVFISTNTDGILLR